MNIRRKSVKSIFVMTLALTFLGTSIVSAGGPKALIKYPIPDHGMLELSVPTSWRGDIHKPQENLPSTIIFSPKKGKDFQVLITVLWDQKGEPGFNNQENVRTLVEKDSKKILPKAIETKIVLKEIRGVNNTGYFFSLTDKAPKPGEFRYMTRGGMTVGNLLLNVTILHRTKESNSVKDALSMLREARQSTK